MMLSKVFSTMWLFSTVFSTVFSKMWPHATATAMTQATSPSLSTHTTNRLGSTQGSHLAEDSWGEAPFAARGKVWEVGPPYLACPQQW